MEQTSDKELIQRYREGDIKAFDLLFNRYKKPLFNFIYRLIGNKANAEDIFQEVFLRAIKGISGYRHQKEFSCWLYRIANNLIIDTFRKEKRGKVVSLETTIKENRGESLLLKDVISDKKHLPSQSLEREELREKLEKAIELLPFEQRQVFVLREHSQLPFKEIASLLSCSVNTALGRMHYALKNLRNHLRETYEDQKR